MSDVKKNVGADGRTLTEYQYNEAIEGAKEYFKGDDLAAMVWVSKYALKDSFGHIFEKSPEQMHWRIANELARIENTYPNPMKAPGDIRPAEGVPLHHPAGRSHDGHRQTTSR